MADFPLTGGNAPWALLAQEQEMGQNAEQIPGEVMLRNQQADLVQQQTLGAQLQNQYTAMRNKWMMGGPPQLGGGATGQPAPASGVSGGPDAFGIDANSIADHVRQKFAVPNTWTPQEQSNLQWAMQGRLFGFPDLDQGIKLQHEARIQSMVQANQIEAQKAYDHANDIGDSVDPLTYLRTHGREDEADQIEQYAQQKGIDPKAVAKSMADTIANSTFRYTGRELEIGKDGIAYDKLSHRPLKGQIPEGMTQSEFSGLMNDAHKTVTRTEGNTDVTKEQWEWDHAPSATAWAMQQANAARAGQLGTAGLGGSNTPAAPSGGAGAAGSPRSFAGARPPAAPNSPAQAGQSPQSGGAAYNSLPAPQKAVIDNLPDGTALPPSNAKINENTQKNLDMERTAKQDLQKTANLTMSQANGELTEFARINNILSTNPSYGPGSGPWASMETALGNWLGMKPSDDAAHRQLLGTILSENQMNSILKEFHGEGAQVRLGAYESRLIMEHLAANPNMAPQAIKQMLAWGSSDASYERDKAVAATAAVRSGKNVMGFDTDYGKAIPKDKTVNVSLDSIKSGGKDAQKLAMEGMHAKGKDGTDMVWLDGKWWPSKAGK